MHDKPASAIDMNVSEWEAFFAEIGEKRFRASQVFAWLWKRGVFQPDEMTDLSKQLREKLAASLDLSFPSITREERAKDGTRKYLLALRDGATVECVLMKQQDRLSACISTQVGCPVGCPFCSTGASGFERDLSKGEIAAQFTAMEKSAGRPISSVVMMGMGEPLLNADEVFGAVAMMNDKRGRELGIRHITISTCGIVPGIVRMADEEVGARLAVSMHAPYDEMRDELVPCNTRYPLAELIGAMRYYQQKTGDRITVEYSLFSDVNDSVGYARKLVGILQGLKIFVNLIPGNSRGRFAPSPAQNVMRFQSVLRSAGFETEVRASRGADIKAACGQLKLAAHG